MSTHADLAGQDPAAHESAHDGACCRTSSPLLDEKSAYRVLRWMTIGGLVLGTFGTFHAVTSLTMGGNTDGRDFVSARLEAVHHLALVTIVCSQVLQLIGSVALWRRRLIGRTLLLAYASIYLAALILVQSMRAIDTASMITPATATQRAVIAMSQMHLVVYGSLFPLFLATILTRPWIVRLLRRKGEPLPVVAGEAAPAADEPRLAA
jgi:hypothetical protein